MMPLEPIFKDSNPCGGSFQGIPTPVPTVGIRALWASGVKWCQMVNF